MLVSILRILLVDLIPEIVAVVAKHLVRAREEVRRRRRHRKPRAKAE